MNNSSNPNKFLRRKPGSSYRQLWIFDKGRYIRARNVYGQYVSEESPRTVEELASDYDLPVGAVREAIAYCEADPPEIREDWEDEERLLRQSRIA
jgi:hypothetical protein